ncbi:MULTISPECIES: HyaD/HybD family hydrogenase maturation endopeptidase [unclassified Thiocapsa]|uniref:HyaD/HybD family hydrogenase maturation endopeptidase n=1 Tax=unclassified Thiocapsa TaxID=2641286 RepID=UPI0035B28FA1
MSDRAIGNNPAILVLGIGNLLWADEGFGVRAVETMQHDWMMPPNVQLLDGGTQGIYLVDRVRTADVLVVFDAVDYGLPPGTMKRVEGSEVPRFLGAKKMSLHQTGFQEVLALASMLGDYPQHLLLIGVQPVELDDFGGSLRPQVKARIASAIAMALEYLAQFGVVAQRRGDSSADTHDLPHPSLGLSSYESGRPAPEVACRIGDERVLASLSSRAINLGKQP